MIPNAVHFRTTATTTASIVVMPASARLVLSVNYIKTIHAGLLLPLSKDDIVFHDIHFKCGRPVDRIIPVGS